MEIIIVDFNNVDTFGKVRLNSIPAQCFEQHKFILSAGDTVMLDDLHSLKNTGIIYFSNEENIWMADIDWNNFQEY